MLCFALRETPGEGFPEPSCAMEASVFRPLRRATKGAAFGNRKPFEKGLCENFRFVRGMFFQESIVEMVSVVSSSTSSSTRTVSREVKIVTLFSVESRRIFKPSFASDVEPRSLVLMT